MSSAATVAATSLVARQPIFDRDRRCVAYELLARNDRVNAYSATNGNVATQQTCDVAMHLVGLQEMTDGRKAFINFTRDLLIDNFAEVLPPGAVVIEVLETVTPDAEVVAACQRLKQQGFAIALDDFTDRPEYAPLVDLADIIKIDLLGTTPQQRAVAEYRLKRKQKQLLAEKVETHEAYEEAKERGYQFFQGYFFCKPQMFARKAVTVDQQVYLRLVAQVSEPQIDFERLESLFRQDPGLSMRLLNYLNSAAMGVRERITSIRHALALLGEAPLRRWALAFAIMSAASDKPRELVRTCLVRARCAEVIATEARVGVSGFEAFLTGLFSALDVMLDQPMEEAVRPLPVSPEVKAALIEEAGALGALRRMIRNIETASWEALNGDAERLSLSLDEIGTAYAQALKWADSFVR